MLGPAARVVGDRLPITPDPHAIQVGGHLDAAADDAGMHGVVVGVQAHVVIAGQPHARAPPGSRRDRRQAQHRGPVGVDTVGRCTPERAMPPPIRPLQPASELRVEVRRRDKAAAGRNEVSRYPLARSTSPLASGSAGSKITTFAPSTPRNACVASVSTVTRRRRLPTAPSPSHTNVWAPPPSSASSCHQPANRSSAVRDGTNLALSHREYPVTMTRTGRLAPLRVCPDPTGSGTAGNQKSHCASSPA